MSYEHTIRRDCFGLKMMTGGSKENLLGIPATATVGKLCQEIDQRDK